MPHLRATLLFFLCFAGLLLTAQTSSIPGIVDEVQLYGGDKITGKVLEYNFKENVIIIDEFGETITVEWNKIKRVDYRFDRFRAEQDMLEQAPEETTSEPETDSFRQPRRAWRHQVTTGINFGITNGRFGRVNLYGMSLAYHYLRPVGAFTLGVGGDVTTFSYSRSENLGALTVLGEFAFPRAAAKQFFLRVEAGPSLPIGASATGDNIIRRSVGYLAHPSIGYSFGASKRGHQAIFVDLGYRLANANFDIETASLDVLRRTINYSRFTLRTGLRF